MATCPCLRTGQSRQAARANCPCPQRISKLNSPSNPTGSVYTKADWAALGEVLRRHPHVLIASDDMYEHIY
ncbi:MAG: aminotransferase class I/II-fold pyridoxal phosphate-dependent enzyme, partial [Thiohalomonadaceae bacterium]